MALLALCVVCYWCISIRPLFGTQRAHRNFRSWATVPWALLAYGWPALLGMVTTVAIADTSRSVGWYWAGVGGSVLGGVLLSVALGYTGTALSMSAPWPVSISSSFKGLRNPWVWGLLVTTAGLNMCLVLGVPLNVDELQARGITLLRSDQSSKTAEDVDKEMDSAVKAAVSDYKRGGLTALKLATDKCYKDAKQINQCMYYDLAGKKIDAFMARQNGFPYADYYSDPEILSRLALVKKYLRLDVDSFNEYSLKVAIKIYEQTLKTMGVKDNMELERKSQAATLQQKGGESAPRVEGTAGSETRVVLLQSLETILEAVAQAGSYPMDSSPSILPRAEEAIATIRALPKPARGNRPVARALLREGLALLAQEGKAAEAAEVLLRASEADPLDVQIANDLGYAEMRAGRYGAAREHIIRALALDPTRAVAWGGLAELTTRTPGASDKEVRRASNLLLVTYWYSRDRNRTLEFMQNQKALPDAHPPYVAAIEAALSRIGPITSPPTKTESVTQPRTEQKADQRVDQEVVVRIGHVAPTSGQIAHLGLDNERGARLAIDELNARGVSIGGVRARFKLVAEDDSADPRRGVSAAQKLVSARVSGVVGHLNSGTSIPAGKVYSEAGIPQISPSATNPRFTRLGYRTAFRVVMNDAQLGRALGMMAVNSMQAKSVLIVDDRTQYGSGLADEFERGLLSAGGRVVGREFISERATDFSSILASLRNNRPDAIFFGGMDNVAGPLLRQMQEQNSVVRFIGGDGICSGELPKLASGLVQDGQVLCAEAGGVEATFKRGMEEFNAAFRRKYGEGFVVYAPYVYDSVNLMVEAMVRAGSHEPSRYLPELARTSGYRGITGPIGFDSNGDLAAGALTVFTFKGGRRESLGAFREATLSAMVAPPYRGTTASLRTPAATPRDDPSSAVRYNALLDQAERALQSGNLDAARAAVAAARPLDPKGDRLQAIVKSLREAETQLLRQSTIIR
jgi:branched-chain amino acid transport system substrate-binding protein